MPVPSTNKKSNDNNYDIDKLQIQEFTLDEMVRDPTIVMIAKRGGGKSWITRAIMFKYSDIPVGIIISPTEQESPFFSNFFPDTFIFYKYDTQILKKLFFRQYQIIKKAREKHAMGKYIDPRAILVMDDCLASKGEWSKDDRIREIFLNGRHKRITYILTMQFPLGILPELRTNIDYVFLLADDTTSNLKRLYEHYAGIFQDFNLFRQVFSQLTQDKTAMVIKNRGICPSLFDKIAYYKAPNYEGKKVKMGCKQFRKFHKRNYDKDWEEKELQQNYYEELLLDKKRRSKTPVAIRKVAKDSKPREQF